MNQEMNGLLKSSVQQQEWTLHHLKGMLASYHVHIYSRSKNTIHYLNTTELSIELDPPSLCTHQERGSSKGHI